MGKTNIKSFGKTYNYLKDPDLRAKEGNEIGSLDLSNSRIGQLEVSGNTVSRGVDFSHTQAKQANVQRLRSDQAKLEGSNIKLAR